MNKNWIYYGVFFDISQKISIKNFAKKMVDIPDDWRFYCDHMTLVYNNRTEDAQNAADYFDTLIGKDVTLTCDAIGISERAIALHVSNFKTSNKMSHITVAIKPDAKPVESNHITDWRRLPKEVSIKGMINVFVAKNNH